MKDFLQQLLDHLKQLEYYQVAEAHSIRYKASEAIRDPALARRINSLKFNTWFLDPPAKRKRIFNRAVTSLTNILKAKISE